MEFRESKKGLDILNCFNYHIPNFGATGGAFQGSKLRVYCHGLS